MALNIVLIVMDATRAQNLSCYGYHRPTTPNLERFAERCVVYETAISPAGWSLPAHASLFTGLFPSQHGAHEQHQYLPPDRPTLAEILGLQGYHTLAFCTKPDVNPATGLDRGFREWNPPVSALPRGLRIAARKAHSGLAVMRGLGDKGARNRNRQVQAALRRLGAHDRPFFLFVHYGESHGPYRPPKRYNRYLPKGVSFESALQVNQDQWKYLAGLVRMDERDFEILTALYDGAITYQDARIGQVLGWLEASGMLDRTVVIITADHGDNIGDHGMLAHKYCLYDSLVHVPLIIHYPPGTTAPGRVGDQAQTLDLVPTILDMLGNPASGGSGSQRGPSLLSITRREFTVAEWARPDLSIFRTRFPGVDVSRYDRALAMIRTPRYKYIWASDGGHELYDLRADRGETRDLITDRADVAANLHHKLVAWRGSFEPATPAQPVPEFHDAVKERLRAWGYLE